VPALDHDLHGVPPGILGDFATWGEWTIDVRWPWKKEIRPADLVFDPTTAC
jgi:hypothetical protein